ncbi:PH domain-containing protein [Cohnella terricola]|uniref:Bacterial Pleckstrin homology domain-containing protein n=1 Tax=Cohnella terricola TaxID=1289167 RepID=A0A559JNJ8_9BACL|nr:hypothetical protein [Cohnella terricola]TVY01450.1 hypothetical protein FPZ45_09965 [Cohnella terricola]
MDLLTAIFLAAGAIICVVMLATYKPQAKYKNGMLFAVMLPAHAMDHEGIRDIQARFNKQFNRTGAWIALSLIPFLLLIRWHTYQSIYFFAWIFAICFVFVVPFRRAFRDTLALKRENDWFVGKKLEQDGTVVYTDDDEYWGNGFTYHNPHDKRILVTKRVGIGQTVNTATGVGKLIIWGTVGVSAALLIGVSFMLIRSELTSPTLTVTPEHRIEIKYPMYSYDFDMADVKEIALVDSVPSGMKTNGEGTNQVARGHFRLKDLGKARLYIFKNNPPYIRIKLEDVYIFYNDKDPRVTEQLYEQLRNE